MTWQNKRVPQYDITRKGGQKDDVASKRMPQYNASLTKKGVQPNELAKTHKKRVPQYNASFDKEGGAKAWLVQKKKLVQQYNVSFDKEGGAKE